MIEEGGVSLHQSHKQFLEKASNSFVFLFPSVKSMRCALPSFMALTIVNRCQDPRDSAASRWCEASSSPPRHISLCKYITSTSTSSGVSSYTECLVWFGLAIDQWELRWLSIIFRPMRRELTMVSSKPLKLTMVSLKPLNLSMVLSNQYSLKRMKLSCGHNYNLELALS